MPLLQARQMVRSKCAALDRRLIRSMQGDATCRTMPGIGPITAMAYVAALEKPDTFKRSRAVAAWLGLSPRRFQSGEVDYDGHISRRGDGQLRALLYEAASVLLTRVPAWKAGFAARASCCGSGSASNARTAHETLGGRTLERPSCGGFMSTADTTLIPAHGPKISLTSSAIRQRTHFWGADLLTNCRQMDFEPSIDQLPAPAAGLPYREWNIQHALLQRRLGHHRLRTHNVRPCRDQAHGCRCPMA
jgi:hypothetical protein